MFIPVSWLLTADLPQLFHNSRSICQDEAVAAQGESCMASCLLLNDGLKNFAIMLGRELRQINKKDNVRPHLFRKRYLLVATTQEKKTIIKNVF